MEVSQGDLSLLAHPVAQQLLQSRIPARLAYVALDGTPRVAPMAFHWTGEEIVLTTWPDAPKVAALRARPQVALTIDSTEHPFKVLTIRGAARLQVVDGVPPEYAAAAERYLGTEAGQARAAQVARLLPRNVRIAIRPEWVSVLDFETRFPLGLARRMAPSAERTAGPQ